ncbi:MAG: hypothetical protein CMJ76_02075 [Planctomycetaceae bacterium]|nr:hypothetical protein [Planctomycetaceae bacterium]|tara:strand:- start:510 stop:1568 length:1059 start_codon:yes stop_codon:yes gene_type:complete
MGMFEDSGVLWPIIDILLKAVGWFCWLIALIWAAAGITFFPKLNSRLGFGLAVVAVTAFLFAAFHYQDRHILIYGVWGFDLLVLMALLCIRPRTDHNWAEDMQRSAQVQIDDGIAIIRNVRDFSYQSESKFAASWITRRIPLQGLRKVWLGVEQISTWEGVAHIFITFEYQDEDDKWNTLAVSAEIRRQFGEEFSVQRGLFRNFELAYVVGTEADLIGLRTHIRLDPVRLYPLMMGREFVQRLFEDVMQRVINLQENPEFYHTITNNCASNMLYHLNKLAPAPISKWDKRIIFTGLVDRIIYALKIVPGVNSLRELRKRYLVDITDFEVDENYSIHLRTVGLSQMSELEADR